MVVKTHEKTPTPYINLHKKDDVKIPSFCCQSAVIVWPLTSGVLTLDVQALIFIFLWLDSKIADLNSVIL